MSTDGNEEETNELFSVQKKRVLEGADQGDGYDQDESSGVAGQKKGRFISDATRKSTIALILLVQVLVLIFFLSM